MKPCVKCGRTKPLSNFYRDPKCRGGFTYDCKECRRARRRRYVAENQTKVLEGLRQYARRPEVRARCAELKRSWNAAHMAELVERQRAYRAANPEKYAARRAVQKALARGELVRQPCEVCGGKAEAHHSDYSRPLDVRWFCRKHHYEVFHREHP